MADQPGCCSAESKFELVCCPVAEEPDAATSVAQQCSCLCVPVGAVVALMTHGQADLGPHIHDEFIDTLSDEEYTSLRLRTVRYGPGPEDEEVFVPIASLRELSKAFAAFLIDRQCPNGGICCKNISLLPLSALLRSIADSSGLQRCIASFLQRPDSHVSIKYVEESQGANANTPTCCPPGQCGCSASDCQCCK